MSLAKTFVGRKWECVIWNYFARNELTQKPKCCVVDVQTGKNCDTFLTWKKLIWSVTWYLCDGRASL